MSTDDDVPTELGSGSSAPFVMESLGVRIPALACGHLTGRINYDATIRARSRRAGV